MQVVCNNIKHAKSFLHDPTLVFCLQIGKSECGEEIDRKWNDDRKLTDLCELQEYFIVSHIQCLQWWHFNHNLFILETVKQTDRHRQGDTHTQSWCFSARMVGNVFQDCFHLLNNLANENF